MNELVEIITGERSKLYDRFAKRLETAFDYDKIISTGTLGLDKKTP